MAESKKRLFCPCGKQTKSFARLANGWTGMEYKIPMHKACLKALEDA